VTTQLRIGGEVCFFMKIDYPWPIPPDHVQKPVWTGHGFLVGEVLVPILSYPIDLSGWTDGLTHFHEDTAGAHHPIDVASRQHALEQLLTYLPKSDPVVLEIGCSSGYMLRLLSERLPQASVMGAD
jgi:hypothetical protein